MTERDAPRWDRVLAPHLTPERQSRLARAAVGIAGAGGLGSNVALVLARSGIGRLVVADHDTVELSNLNRQAYLPHQIGKPKVAALRALLRRIRPDLKITARALELRPENVVSVFQGCDVVVEAVDLASTKRILAETLTRAGFRVVSASGMAGWGGPPMSRRDMGLLTVVGDHVSEITARNPAMGPRVLMAAAMQADVVLDLLLAEPFSPKQP